MGARDVRRVVSERRPLDRPLVEGLDGHVDAAALGLPDHVRLLTGIAVGHRGDPAEAPEAERDREAKPRTRKPLDEVAMVRWGEAW